MAYILSFTSIFSKTFFITINSFIFAIKDISETSSSSSGMERITDISGLIFVGYIIYAITIGAILPILKLIGIGSNEESIATIFSENFRIFTFFTSSLAFQYISSIKFFSSFKIF